jgi:hypothetical protein
MKKLFFALLLTTLASGCANRIYDWDNYDGRLYRYYKDPTSSEEFRVSMEQHFKSLEGRNLRPAPGLYAELGTLHLERGDRTTAATYYAKERDAWPESRYMMDAMLTNLQKPLTTKEQK